MVVACGFRAAQLTTHPAHEAVHELPDPMAPEFLDAGRALLEWQPTESALVLLHADRRDRARRVCMLRALTRHRSLAGVGLTLPPTGLAARATWLATLAHHRVPAGVAVSHLLRHPATLPTLVEVSSLAGVELACVRFREHLSSLIPGRTFGLVFDDGARLVSRSALPLDLGEVEYVRVAAAGGELTPRFDWGLDPGAEEARLSENAPANGWWGSAKYIEWTLIPRDPLPTVGMLANQQFGRCAQCGGAASGFCPFCLAREEHAA